VSGNGRVLAKFRLIQQRLHDARIAEIGLDIWVGSEPTFTDRKAA
jgi:hypothetical protein